MKSRNWQTISTFARAKNAIRRRLLAVAAAALLVTGSGGAFAQGIPVIDVSSLGQAVIMVENLKQQVQTLAQQYQTMTSQLQALTGNRGLGMILNDPSLTNYLPSSWQSIYQQVKGGGLPSITSAMQQIERAEAMSASTAGQQRYNDTLAANKAMAMQAYQASMDRLTNIQALMQQSNLTQDPAAKADLQNRLNAETAMINNEQIRLGLMKQLADAEERFAAKQQLIDFQNSLGDTDGTQ